MIDTEIDPNLSRKTFHFKDNYKAVKRLGKGTYGTVYLVYKNENKNDIYAIKKIKMENENEGIPSTALREISILQCMAHENVVRICDIAITDKNIELCLEYCRYDLRKLIMTKKNDSKFYDVNFIKTIMYQLLKSVDHLHSHKVLHRDLKPQNILIKFKNNKVIDKNFQLKLADFGLSRVYSIPIRPYTREVLTLWYRAPEMLLGIGTYSIGLDMWSIGCIFAELYLKEPVFMGDSEVDQLFKIMQVFGTFNDMVLPGYKAFPYYNKDYPFWTGKGLEKYIREKTKVDIDDNAIDLLKKMLDIDPVKRISCKEALRHKFFENMEGSLN